jgi:hypothetical protein
MLQAREATWKISRELFHGSNPLLYNSDIRISQFLPLMIRRWFCILLDFPSASYEIVRNVPRGCGIIIPKELQRWCLALMAERKCGRECNAQLLRLFK